MTLKEFLETNNPHDYIKIGAVDGSMYVYGGQVCDFIPDFYEWNKRPFMHKHSKFQTVKSKKKLPLSKNDYDGIDLIDREVCQIFPSISEKDVTNVLVDGDELGDVFCARPMEPLKPESVSNDAVLSIMGAAYKENTNKLLEQLYKFERTKDDLDDINRIREVLIKTLDETKAKVNATVRSIRANSMDPSGDSDMSIIKEAHRIARKRLEDEKREEEELARIRMEEALTKKMKKEKEKEKKNAEKLKAEGHDLQEG